MKAPTITVHVTVTPVVYLLSLDVTNPLGPTVTPYASLDGAKEAAGPGGWSEVPDEPGTWVVDFFDHERDRLVSHFIETREVQP